MMMNHENVLPPPPTYEETVRGLGCGGSDVACGRVIPPAYTDVDLGTVTHSQVKTSGAMGLIDIYLQGDWSNRAGKVYFLTVHDTVYDYRRFVDVMASVEMQKVLKYSIWIHVQVPEVVESLTQLSRCLESVMNQLNIRNAVLLGEGAGANVVCQFAIETPNRCMGMILIDYDAGPPRGTGFVLDKLLKKSDSSNRPGKTYEQAYNERDSQLAAMVNGLRCQTLLLYASDSASTDQSYQLSRQQPMRITAMISPYPRPLAAQHRREFLRAFLLFCKGCGFMMSVPLVGVRADEFDD